MDNFLSETDPIFAELRRCEIRVWEALRAGDAKSDAAALADDFLGVYPDGFAEKSDHLEQLLHGPSVLNYALENFLVRRLGEEHALISYRAVLQRSSTHESEAVYVTSIWRRVSSGWLNIFSQDTPERP